MTEKYVALADRLGAERSTRVRYQKAHDAQQKRIRELENVLRAIETVARASQRGGVGIKTAKYDFGGIADRAADILKGAK